MTEPSTEVLTAERTVYVRTGAELEAALAAGAAGARWLLFERARRALGSEDWLVTAADPLQVLDRGMLENLAYSLATELHAAEVQTHVARVRLHRERFVWGVVGAFVFGVLRLTILAALR